MRVGAVAVIFDKEGRVLIALRPHRSCDQGSGGRDNT